MPAVIPFGAEGAPVNPPNAPLAGASSRWNFAVEDATPEIPLNEAIWKSVRAAGRRCPRRATTTSSARSPRTQTLAAELASPR